MSYTATLHKCIWPPGLETQCRRRLTHLRVVALASFCALTASVSVADTLVFGPKTYGFTVVPVVTTFNVVQPSGPYVLRLTKHSSSQGLIPITPHAVITLNGQPVLDSQEFTPVTLQNGANTLSVKVEGDLLARIVITIVNDTTPPTITASATPPANANGWNNGSVRVQFACLDLWGIAKCTKPATVVAEGAHEVVGIAADITGNTATTSIAVNIDKTAPIVTATTSPPPNADGWYAGPVLITFSATDTLSGVAPGSLTAPILLPAEGNNFSASGQATDLAGNGSSITTTGINIDFTSPTITVALSRPPDANGWYSSPVTAYFTCTDALSGVASCPPDQTIAAEGANQTIQGTAFDFAGNEATTSVVISLDTTPPDFVTSPADGAVVATSLVTMTGTLTDLLSGVAGATCDGQPATIQADNTFSCPLTLEEGLNTFTLSATDTAGNSQQPIVSLTRQCTNLVDDPGFESGVSGFFGQESSGITPLVTQTTSSPLEGLSSLLINTPRYGDAAWWQEPFGGRASRIHVSAHLRSDLESTSTLRFCAAAYYADTPGTIRLNCTLVPGAVGDKGVISAVLDLDPTKAFFQVDIFWKQEGAAPLEFTVDNAFVCLDVVASPPPPPAPARTPGIIQP